MHNEVINNAQHVLRPRGAEYGSPRSNHKRIAIMASIMLNREVTDFDVAIILMCVKLSRVAQSAKSIDSYIDLINYTAFAAEFATEQDIDD